MSTPPSPAQPPPGVPQPPDGLESVLTDALHLVKLLVPADSATVLLLDQSGTLLRTEAAVGNDASVRTRFQVPVGAGFAGTVAATRSPAHITAVDFTKVINPHLLESGVQSLLGVPLVHGDVLYGVLHVGTLSSRPFTEIDLEVLTAAAGRLAHTVATFTASARDSMAIALQRALLPAVLPVIEGLDLAARYLPADGHLGGDWHDVFVLPSGAVGIVIGDVIGHGFEAAVVMGRLRSALRAYALEHADPAEVLVRLDAKIQFFEAGAMATVLFAVAHPPFDQMTVSSAGHLAPLMATAHGACVQVPIEADPPLGIDPTIPRVSHRVGIPDAASLLFFTDGLVERRPHVDTHPQGQLETGLAAVSEAFRIEAAEDSCNRVVTAAVGQLPRLGDDVAVLIARRVNDAEPGPPRRTA